MLKKLIAMTIVTTMLLSSFCIIAQAEYEYSYGEQIAYEGATASSYEDSADSQVSKKLAMNGNNRISTEGDASYYFIFNNYTRNTTSGNLRLSHSNTQDVVFKSKGNLLNVKSTGSNNVSIAGQNFYSSSPDLFARLALVDSQASSSTNISTNSQKLTASTMTYEFDIQYKTNFFDVIGYVSTHLAGSFSNRSISAIKIDNEGNLYSTSSNFSSTNPIHIGNLSLGIKHRISVVIELIPTETTNKYDYTMEVYLDGVKKFYTPGSDMVTAANTKFYGFEFDFRPWTVNTDFSASTVGFTGTADGYYGYGNATSTKLTVSGASDLNEYTIIDTDTMISDFTVYAGNKYAINQPALNGKDTDFYISSNVRNNTNYVTVAAQTAADDATGTGTIVLATYNASGALESIKTSPITLTKGAITEQDIDISTANANETKLFIINSTSAMTPLAQSTVLN